MHKTPRHQNIFASGDVEKVHAVVARSTFASEKWQTSSVSDHYWKVRCRKSARWCGAKHSVSKTVKIAIARATFGSCDVEKVHAVAARSTFGSENVQNTSASEHFWKL